MSTRFAVVIGLDVGKSGHHVCALDLDVEKLFDKPLPQDEAKLRDLFTGLQDRGEVLMVVDQPNTIGALDRGRQVDRNSEVLSTLKVLAGFDEDLAHETTRALNRIRSLLTQIHPALECVFTGSTLSTALVLVIPRIAGQVKELKEQRATVARRSRACWRTFLSPRS